MLLKKSFSTDALRTAIDDAYRMDEEVAVNQLLETLQLSDESIRNIHKRAENLVKVVRDNRMTRQGLDAFLYEYDLSTEEGITLMCLAEAFLRIPDKSTVDRLIKDKITATDWQSRIKQSDSLWVNTTTWALMITGKVLSPDDQSSAFGGVLKKLIKRSGEPIIRTAVQRAMKLLSQQFVMGRDIEKGLKRAIKQEKKGYRYSYDMLGEVARTEEDAKRYFKSYVHAIQTIGIHSKDKDVFKRPGISIKISALHPRFQLAQIDNSQPLLSERVKELVWLAKEMNIGLTIDAEEADTLEYSLDLIESIFSDPLLAGWEGFGVAVQAYQKRAPYVLDFLAHLARKHSRRIKLRLVKGAYWDTEIKIAQELGSSGYPVYTRKANTDVSYLACAKKIASMTDAFYPQFATHNAHTIATIIELMGNNKDFEFQCLHGMGHSLYDHIVGTENLNIPCRVYAPVGRYEELLPYLVRRLLENGANTSFVNRVVDSGESIESIIADPIAKVKQYQEKAHPKIPLPKAIYGANRPNSDGIDLTSPKILNALDIELDKALENNKLWQAKPLLGETTPDAIEAEYSDVVSPTDNQIIGKCFKNTADGIKQAIDIAEQNTHTWRHRAVADRVQILHKAADLLEARFTDAMMLATREAGKTIPDAVAEVREAIDFCRYYANLAEKALGNPILLQGYTGESNTLTLLGRGIFLCVSPWNFPLAIFIGQISAALVAGNCVIAKPAGETALIAHFAVQLLHEAGIPREVLQLVICGGRMISSVALSDTRIAGVMLTGSTDTGRAINQALANRAGPIVPFIAETGGQNTMIVDSSALPEQVTKDVIISAFGSAGQRCSALRVLYIQDDIADSFIHMLAGAMAELKIGNPRLLSTDIGPVINSNAKNTLMQHIEKMQREAKLIYQCQINASYAQQGFFVPPTAFEIDHISQLECEVFGPVLHVIRYARKDLDQVLTDIHATGFGLTLGIHSRIDETIQYIKSHSSVGNTYVNRNMIGAIVGVQPFGGERLSGTGPKAGGPHYLYRLCSEHTFTVNTTATGGNASLMSLEDD